MEMTEKYLDDMTVIADFWVSNSNNDIKSIDNEGIIMKKSKIYLNKYHVNIILKPKEADNLETFVSGWQNRYPKVVITKGSGRVESYSLTFLKKENKNGMVVVNCIGVPDK